MPNPPKPVTFDAFVTAESRSRVVEQSGPSPFRQLVAQQLIKAKLVPASRSSQLTDAAETATFLSDSVLDMHSKIVNDGGSTMTQRRLSYQAVCLHFIMLMAMAGGIEPPQE
jgi:hypothetical protein